MAARLEVQYFLKNDAEDGHTRTLEELSEKLGIKITKHDELPLVILNYNQISSPKLNSITRECRGLILEEDTWRVVSKGFHRFFNLGEVPEQDDVFDWHNYSATEKEDGSIMFLWHYQGHWHCSTRGSFAQGCPNPDHHQTWKGLFFSCLPDEIDLPKENSYVFEFVSPYNKVVRRYEKPNLFLLSSFNLLTNEELTHLECDLFSVILGVDRPKTSFFGEDPQEVLDFIAERGVEDKTWEGLVLRDKDNLRVKCKSHYYLALHHLKGEESVFSAKRLLPFVLVNEGGEDEVLLYFPEAEPRYREIQDRIFNAYKEADNLWYCYQDEPNQKKFALSIEHAGLKSVLFNCRGKSQSLEDFWEENKNDKEFHKRILRLLDSGRI